jgi:hypothetical protein
MRLAKSALILAAALPAFDVAAQQGPDIDKAVSAMVRLCLGGGRTEAVTGGGAGGVDLSLRTLDARGNLQGEFKVSRSSAEGLVEGINSAMSQVAADQADKVRACLQPVRDRVLDIMLPPNAKQNAQPAPTAQIDGEWRSEPFVKRDEVPVTEQQYYFKIRQIGSRLVGEVSYVSPAGTEPRFPHPIQGSREGDAIIIEFFGDWRTEDANGKNAPMKETFYGTVSGDQIRFTYFRERSQTIDFIATRFPAPASGMAK